jgi:hypothetical protein
MTVKVKMLMNNEDDSVYRTFKAKLQCKKCLIFACLYKKSMEYTTVFMFTTKAV